MGVSVPPGWYLALRMRSPSIQSVAVARVVQPSVLWGMFYEDGGRFRDVQRGDAGQVSRQLNIVRPAFGVQVIQLEYCRRVLSISYGTPRVQHIGRRE